MFVCPGKSCVKCSRLLAFRQQNEATFPYYYNAPVPSFGELSSEILIIGLAPGLHGANQTGRPFTNDYAGDVLYPALLKYGLAQGQYKKIKDDGFELLNVRITNAVRCVPPQNKVTGEEVKNCGLYLLDEINNMPRLKVVLTLGAVAHNAFLSVMGCQKSRFKFAHGAVHKLPQKNLLLLNSYHTSRYNINTGVLTVEMFNDIIKKLKDIL